MEIITLTKQGTPLSQTARQGSAIGITPEMIEAGIGAIRAVDYEFWEGRTPEELSSLVMAIYTAATEVRGSSWL